jgi:hypothetical protein
MFEKKLARDAGEGWQQLNQIARRAFECVPQGASKLKVSGIDESKFVTSRCPA